MDGSVAGRGCLALMLRVVYHGRALPLCWVVVSAPKGHFPEKTHCALLAQVQTIMPQDAQVTFLGHGEFDGVDVQADLCTNGWHYVCRTASTVRVRAFGVHFHVGDLGPPRGELLAVTPAWMTAQQYGPVSILAIWELPFKEPIDLVTNLDDLDAAVQHYKQRPQIETFFSDQKSRGFQIHQSHVRDPKRLSRLLIASCLAYLWIVYLGVCATRADLDAPAASAGSLRFESLSPRIAVAGPLPQGSYPNPGWVSRAASVTKDFYPKRGAFRSSNKPLADTVIDILLEAALFSRQSPQVAFGRLGMHRLKRIPASLIAFSHPLNRCAAVDRSIRVGCDVHDTQIDTQKAGRLIARGIGFGLGDVQIPDLIAAYQFCPADLPAPIIERVALEVAQCHLPNHPPVQGVQAHLIEAHQPIGAYVVPNRAIIAEGRTGFLAKLARLAIPLLWSGMDGANGLRRFVSGTARQLRSQSIGRAGCAIDNVMQLVLVRDLLFPSDRRAVGRGLVERNLGCTQRRISRTIKHDFAAYGTGGDSSTHGGSIPQSERMCKRRLSRQVFMRRYSFPLLGLKPRSFQLVRF